jgi:murein DD-endopeptidase MepM/ murein hydrolase activator NlpD
MGLEGSAAAKAALLSILMLVVTGSITATATATATAPAPMAPAPAGGVSGLPVPALPGSVLPLAPTEPAAGGAGRGWRWPLPGTPHVVRGFAPPPQPWQPGHRGVDLAAAPGTVVVAAGPGVVGYAGQLAGRGVVSVAHANGLRTTYEPVTASVRVGDQVAGGQALGVLESGHDGCPAQACLHWGLRRDEVYLDPLSVLGLGRVRLLPAYRAGRPGGSADLGVDRAGLPPAVRAARAARRRGADSRRRCCRSVR